MRLFIAAALSSALLMSGCAELKFGASATDDGVTFYDPAPFLVVSYDKDCVASASVLTLPDASKPRHVKPQTGYGTANLTASFSNGMLTSFGQQTDTKIPDSVPQVLALAKQFGITGDTPRACAPGKPPELYRIVGQGGELVFKKVTVSP